MLTEMSIFNPSLLTLYEWQLHVQLRPQSYIHTREDARLQFLDFLDVSKQATSASNSSLDSDTSLFAWSLGQIQLSDLPLVVET